MKRFAKITSVATAFVLALGLTACSSSAPTTGETNETNDAGETTDGAAASNDNVLIMATNAEFPPYEYKEDQTIKGIEVDIMNAIADELGMELQIEDMQFDSVISAVKSGKADVGVSGMTVTEDRLLNIDFTEPYITASQLIIKRADDDGIVNNDSLVGKTIGVQLGTTGDLYATNIEGSTVERFNKGFEAVQALKQSKIDAVIIDDQVAKALAEGNDDVTVLEEPFTQEDYAICVNKGNTELLNKLNESLANLKESGKLQEIIDSYISAE